MPNALRTSKAGFIIGQGLVAEGPRAAVRGENYVGPACAELYEDATAPDSTPTSLADADAGGSTGYRYTASRMLPTHRARHARDTLRRRYVHTEPCTR
jgi:hypothetical protein